PKSVDSMAVPELLTVAAAIKIENTTLKRLHETGRVNDEGMRRIVRAYLRGESLEWVISQNLMSPEALVSKAEQAPTRSDDTAAIKQAISSQGTTSNFALPSLNYSNDQPV